MTVESIAPLLERASAARSQLLDARSETAFRLLNGFTEGCPDLSIDVYASTVVIYNHADPLEGGNLLVEEALQFVRMQYPWLRSGIVKVRNSSLEIEKRGKILFGATLADKVRENDIWYAINLTLNQDASLYLDTRNLRSWALRNLRQKAVLNTFAYTGSLGVAALMGGAERVFQLDRNRQFLDLARSSYSLNGLPIHARDFSAADFWDQISRLKRSGERFDCVFIDPPFFATSSKGIVDQVNNSAGLINKVRPLINDGGYLIAINNALFVSGAAYMKTLEMLCADGYLKILELIPVPEDFTGYPETRVGPPITDPAPFNHATKIAVLQVRRKQAGARPA
jgi:23S rRNA (cytosine1962-C5)-methyltransferase